MGVVRLACSAMEPWLERAAAVWPSRVAIDSPSGSLTYAALRERADSLAAGPGDRVAIGLAFGLDFAIAVHACLFRGAVAVPVDGRLPEHERAAQVREAGIVVDAPLAPGPAPRPPPPRPRPRSGRSRARRPHVRHHGVAAAGHALLRQRAGERPGVL